MEKNGLKLALVMGGFIGLAGIAELLINEIDKEPAKRKKYTRKYNSNIKERPMIVGFRQDTPQPTDCGKQSIKFENGKIDVLNITTMENDPDCYFSAATRFFDDGVLDNLTDVYCVETGSRDFVLPKGETRTIHFEGKIDSNLQERLGFRRFEGEYQVLGI